MDFIIEPGGRLEGDFTVPGDKSISHRALMLASLADGDTYISGFLQGEDCLATARAMRDMGVTITLDDDEVSVQGVGMEGLQQPGKPLNLGNSGTSMRLLCGIMAAQAFDSILTGDESLQSRPMQRVTDPLSLMGAVIRTAKDGMAPLKIEGGHRLSGITYRSPVASAQVKSCLLLAGLHAEGETRVIEPGVSRDHTERMLQLFGYPVSCTDNQVALLGHDRLQGTHIEIPGDISSASFFMTACAVQANSRIRINNLGVNPTRTGVVRILREMGADIEVKNERLQANEPVADIIIQGGVLTGIDIPQEWVPLAIDEFPAILVAAACAEGETRLRGAAELRVKESDRIETVASGLKILGIDVEVMDDGIILQGEGSNRPFTGGVVDAHGDHRIAMAFAMAGLMAREKIVIRGCDNVNTSFPGFVHTARLAGLKIEVA